MARSRGVTVKGDEQAEAVILRAGRKSGDQSGSLNEAATVRAVQKGDWENKSGALTASLNETETDDSSLRSISGVPYARYVFYGTSRQGARPPVVSEDELTQAVIQRVANDLVGE